MSDVDVSALARVLADRYPEDEGYIVAFYSGKPGNFFESPDTRDAKYKVLFLKLHSNPRSLTDVTGGSLNDAHLFSTYDEAATAAKSWVHSNKPSTRILFVRRRRPIEILGDMSAVGVLDALAEV